ncbi:unnamed protein product [Moneuplotes crassus]|uniref:RING-type E3 ubiquitin transferase n=1 Tax=Euplotes crassus TaxID=5936 RepID=A0AAD1Y2R1_EUPCR|nr:unnamed protein product [Moneuplotes crassus]
MEKKKKGGSGALIFGIGAALGAVVAAGITYFATSNTKETVGGEESKETQHIPPPLPSSENIPKDVEEKLLCPISLEVMTDPVVTPYGHTFDRQNIESYIEKYGICPMTRKPLTKESLIPNYSIREMISHFNSTREETKE